MRALTRRERAALSAADHALDHNPGLRHLLVEDYGIARLEIGTLRRRLNAASRDPNEPGSKPDVPANTNQVWGVGSRSNLKPGDGVSRYGEDDHTGFGEGCVF